MCQSPVNQTVCGSVHVTVLFSISSLVSLSFCSVHQDDPQRLHRSSIDVLDPISDQFYEEAWMFTSARYTSIYQKVFHCRPSSDAGGLPGQCWPTQRGPGSKEPKKILAFLVSFLFSSYPNKTFLHLLAPKRLWCPWRSGPEACAHHVDRKHSDTILEMLTVTSEANWTTQLQQE
ncbi:phospholipase D1-like [Astatotilapia calliptera]|uniref:phospholipase D1-like n=1 Tax=Astatotilapia calliptera TaxID=8154 RepID=UPI000E417E22|nr:phospholipase D1-like [Astatotilapia calliptera]